MAVRVDFPDAFLIKNIDPTIPKLGSFASFISQAFSILYGKVANAPAGVAWGGSTSLGLAGTVASEGEVVNTDV